MSTGRRSSSNNSRSVPVSFSLSPSPFPFSNRRKRGNQGLAHVVAVVVCVPGGLAAGVVVIPLEIVVRDAGGERGRGGCTWLFVPVLVVV